MGNKQSKRNIWQGMLVGLIAGLVASWTMDRFQDVWIAVSPPDDSKKKEDQIDPSEETGVADVRLVREKIALQYKGDLRQHVAETDRIVQPLIEKLGLKEGVPPKKDDRRSGAEG